MINGTCPECKSICELDTAYIKWSKRQVYKCTKCGTLLIKCWGCERMTRVHKFYDEAYCEQCAPKIIRNASTAIATVAIAVFTGGKLKR